MRVFLTIIMVAAIYASNANAQHVVKDGITYSIYYNYAKIQQCDDLPPQMIIPDSVIYDGKSYHVYNIRTSLFCNNTQIISLTIPNRFYVKAASFGASENLEEIILGDSIQLEDYCFGECPKLQKIVFKGKEYAISENAITWSQSNMKRGFYMVSSTPPKVIDSTTAIQGELPQSRFHESVYHQVVLYVPVNAVESYKKDAFWGRFPKIDVWNELTP